MRRGRSREFAAGETVFLRGDPGDALYVIEAGRIEVSVLALGGRRSVVNRMGPGEILGEIALLDGGLRSADATAGGSGARLLVLRRGEIVSWLGAHPEAAMGLIGELCSRVRDALEIFENQAQTNARARLARCLLRVAAKWGKPHPGGGLAVAEALSQSEIGEFSGLSRENVNRTLKALAEEGLLHLEDGRPVIDDVEGLEDVAELSGRD